MDHHRWRLRCEPPPLEIPLALGEELSRREARSVQWRRSSPGHYVSASADRAVVEQRIAEESGRLPEGGAVTGWAALRLHGGNLFDGTIDGVAPLPVPLVVPQKANLRPAPGVSRRRARLPSIEVMEVCGVRCTVPARALLDAVDMAAGWREAVAIIDQALAADLVSLTAFEDWLGGLSRAAGLTRARRCLPWVERRTRSPKETVVRLLWHCDAGLPRPLCNWPVASATGIMIGIPDLLSPELGVVGQYDGADHLSGRQQGRDVRFDDQCRDLGLEVFRVTGQEIHRPEVVLDRIQRTVARARESTRERTYSWRRDPAWP